MVDTLEMCGLKLNPFEPAASGPPITAEALWMPQSWKTSIIEALDRLRRGQGPKVVPLYGEYGSGKTYVLKWLEKEVFPERRVRSFYIDNPGVQFYDLANSLLRQIGRKDFAKYLWELAEPHVDTPHQLYLFSKGYEAFVQSLVTSRRQSSTDAANALQSALLKAKVSSDEEICSRLARVVIETPSKPYFEYRDFVPRSKGSIVAENEEAPYFAAILRTLKLGANVQAVAFLIDEFEEISVRKRLSRREAQDYLATLKRLVNLTTNEDLWIVLTMTPDGKELTGKLEPALWERTCEPIPIAQLTQSDAAELISDRLKAVRPDGFAVPAGNGLFPFPKNTTALLQPSTLSSPRRVVKVCFAALSRVQEHTPLPFSEQYVREAEQAVYPSEPEN